MRPTAFLLPLLAVSSCAQHEAAPKELPTIAARTASMPHMPGLLPLHWDAEADKIYLEIDHLG